MHAFSGPSPHQPPQHQPSQRSPHKPAHQPSAPPSAAPFSRRSLLAAAAAAPLAAAPILAAPAAAATRGVVGGARLAAGGVQAGAGAAALPRKLTARAWLVADHDSGEVLAAYRAHLRLAPASTLKMLFADTLLDRFPRTERRTVTDADLAGVPSGSSLVGLRAGVTYTVEQLWLGVFLRSGNDAVQVLARMNGGVAKTVAEMQARAADLQALDTHVVSPDGYDQPGQLSSAYDLALFARHGLRDAGFRAYCATRTARFPDEGGRTRVIENTDRLLSGSSGVTPYPGLIGVKNGFTSNAGNTFAGAATRAGRTLIVTVLHPESGHNAVYEETAALLDWGFAQGSSARPVGTLVEASSEGGKKATAAAAPPYPGVRQASSAGGGPNGWGMLGGAGGAVALAVGGAYALRRRRTRQAAQDS